MTWTRSAGNTFTYPEFYVPFPVAVNPALEEASTRMWRWVDEFDLAPTERSRWLLRRSHVDQAAAYYFPTADVHALVLIAQWYAWILQIDDIYDDRPPEYRAAQWSAALDDLIAVLGPGSPSSVGTFSTALTELWSRTSTGRSPAWCHRLVSDFSAFLGCYHTDMANRTRDHLPEIEEYLDLRTVSYAMLTSTNFAEMAAGIDLPDQVHQCPEFAELRKITGLHAGLINDIFSYRKEMMNNYPYNAVHILRTTHKSTIQEAVDGVNDIATNCVKRFIDIEYKLPTALSKYHIDIDTRTDALRCVSVLKSMIRGNVEWCGKVPRYAEPEGSASYFADLITPTEGFGTTETGQLR